MAAFTLWSVSNDHQGNQATAHQMGQGRDLSLRDVRE